MGCVKLNGFVKAVFLVVFFVFPGAGFCLDWEISTVRDDVGIGDSSIDLDSSERPHIFYYKFYEDYPSEYGIGYDYWDGSDWQTEFEEWVSLMGDNPPGFDLTIKLDSYDDPHFLYHFSDNYHEIYELISLNPDSLVDYYGDINSLALDSVGVLHVAYESEGLKYGFWNGTEWDTELVDAGGAVSVSLALDSSDNPHIAYCGGLYGDRDLIYAKWDGSSWVFEDIDTDGNVGFFCSIGLDSYGYPHVSYIKHVPYEYEELKYAKKDGSGWQIETVDTIGYELSTEASMVLDNSDHPHIAYAPESASGIQLKYAYFNGYDWSIETVDEYWSCITNFRPSITLDSSDEPHISYNRTFTLKYARGFENTPPSSFNLTQPPEGGEVSEPVTLDWEDSTDDDGHDITYDVWYATDPSFDPHDEVNELTESTYTFPEGVLTQGETYYWKVRAWDGWDETWSGPDPYWSFTVEEEVTDISVTRFSAESARTGIELTWECADAGVGFNLYRSVEATGMRSKSREVLNAELITGESPYVYLDSNVSDGVTYAYWLEAVDLGGAGDTFGPVTCTAGTFVPSSYALYQSRPNPARGTAVIAFDLPEDADVTLTIYDLSGRKVTTLVNEKLPAGAYERPISNLAPGVYVYRLEAGEFSGVRKMVVID